MYFPSDCPLSTDKERALKVSATAESPVQAPGLKIELLPRPGTPERKEFDRTGKLPTGYSDSSMELVWCLSPELLEEIKQLKHKLWILVVVENQGNEKARYVVPFDKGYCLVMFPSVGVNTIHVTGVWGSDDDISKTLERRERGRYQTESLEYFSPTVVALRKELLAVEAQLDSPPIFVAGTTGEVEDTREAVRAKYHELRDQYDEARWNMTDRTVRIRSFNSIGRLDFEVTDSVVVDASMFAKPWALTKRLANIYPFFAKNPSFDGCQDRRRAYMITLPTLWIYGLYLLGKSLLGAVLAAAGLFMGWRDLQFAPIFKPHGRDPFDVTTYHGSSRWWSNDKNRDRHALFPFAYLNPITISISGILAAAATTMWARYCFPKLGWTEHFVQMWTAGPWWFYTIVALAAGTGSAAKVSYSSTLGKQLSTTRKERKAKEMETFRQRSAELTCSSGNKLTKPAAKPPVFLRPLEAGKERFCRPNAR